MSVLFGPDAFEGSTCLACGAPGQGDECSDCHDERETGKAGHLNGRHFTTYVDDVKELKRAGDIEGAVQLLWKLFRHAEAEAAIRRWGIPGWYSEQLGICYRKLGRPDLEIMALDAYEASPANTAGAFFAERRAKAQAILARHHRPD